MRTFLSVSLINRLRLIIAALLTTSLLVAACLSIAAIPRLNWNDRQWTHFLERNTFTLTSQTGTVLATNLSFTAPNIVTGLGIRNDMRWRWFDGALQLVSPTDHTTVRFNAIDYPDFGFALIGDGNQSLAAQRLTQNGNSPFFRALIYGVLAALAALIPWWFPPALAGPNASSNGGSVLWLVGIALIGAWLWVITPLWFSMSYMTDEVWFLSYAIEAVEQTSANHASWIDTYLFAPNYLGYGSLWWSLYTVVVSTCKTVFASLLPDGGASKSVVINMLATRLNFWDLLANGKQFEAAPIYLLRAGALFLAALTCLRVLRDVVTRPLVIISLVGLLTAPVLYWSGKVASPELYAALLTTLAVYCYFRRPAKRWLFIAGLAVGLKLNCLPLLVALLIVATWTPIKQRHWRQVIAMIGVALLGALSASGHALVHPIHFMQTLNELRTTYHPASDYLTQFMYITARNQPFWDGTSAGNLNYWFGGWLKFGCFTLAALAIVERRYALWFCFAAPLMFAYLMTQSLHGWYWFGFLLCTALSFCFARPAHSLRQRSVQISIALCAGIACVSALPLIEQELRYRSLHHQELTALADQRQCIAKLLSRDSPWTVYDLYTLGGSTDAGQGALRVNYFESFLKAHQPMDVVRNGQNLLVYGLRAPDLRPIQNWINTLLQDNQPSGHCGTASWIRF